MKKIKSMRGLEEIVLEKNVPSVSNKKEIPTLVDMCNASTSNAAMKKSAVTKKNADKILDFVEISTASGITDDISVMTQSVATKELYSEKRQLYTKMDESGIYVDMSGIRSYLAAKRSKEEELVDTSTLDTAEMSFGTENIAINELNLLNLDLNFDDTTEESDIYVDMSGNHASGAEANINDQKERQDSMHDTLVNVDTVTDAVDKMAIKEPNVEENAMSVDVDTTTGEKAATEKKASTEKKATTEEKAASEKEAATGRKEKKRSTRLFGK